MRYIIAILLIVFPALVNAEYSSIVSVNFPYAQRVKENDTIYKVYTNTIKKGLSKSCMSLKIELFTIDSDKASVIIDTVNTTLTIKGYVLANVDHGETDTYSWMKSLGNNKVNIISLGIYSFSTDDMTVTTAGVVSCTILTVS